MPVLHRRKKWNYIEVQEAITRSNVGAVAGHGMKQGRQASLDLLGNSLLSLELSLDFQGLMFGLRQLLLDLLKLCR
jgi:hypothetical protein